MSKRRIFQGYAAFILGCAFTLFGLCYSLRKPLPLDKREKIRYNMNATHLNG